MRGDGTRSNPIADGGFDGAGGWTAGDGWTIAGGEAQHASGLAGSLSRALSLVERRTSRIEAQFADGEWVGGFGMNGGMIDPRTETYVLYGPVGCAARRLMVDPAGMEALAVELAVAAREVAARRIAVAGR